MRPRRRHHGVRTTALYVRTLVGRFKVTLWLLAGMILVGGVLFAITPQPTLGGRVPAPFTALFAAWMALFAQAPFQPPETWYLAIVCGVYPLFGFVLVGEGIVRLSLLILSRQEGEKEWMKVMASTYRDHIVLCGLGHLGYRILGQLIQAGERVVAIEKDAQAKFMNEARATGVPVLIRDMKEDQSLLDAGIEHARTIIIATNDDMANLEVALDSRRMNPRIRILMRMFDQQIASKVKDALEIDEAFSSAALAAPIVAARSTAGGNVVASYAVGGVTFTSIELRVEAGSALAGKPVGELERAHGAKVLVHVPSGGGASSPRADARIEAGDRVVVHAVAEQVQALVALARATAAQSSSS